ncbi:MAG: FG-GAP repeat protein [Candidatus Omnitrophota bacterium]|nr:MAG: FG-GAP repeat protein [Candidatus Omnitrophota bacterium]
MLGKVRGGCILLGYSLLILFFTLSLVRKTQADLSSIIPPFACDFYGEEEAYGTLKAGSIITAKDSQGNIVGEVTATEDGRYGFLTCRADDPATPEDEGASEGETITFYINGVKRQKQAVFKSGQAIRVDLLGLSSASIPPPEEPFDSSRSSFDPFPIITDPEGKLVSFSTGGSGLSLIAIPLVPKYSEFEKMYPFKRTRSHIQDIWEFKPSNAVDPWKHFKLGCEKYSDLKDLVVGKGYWAYNQLSNGIFGFFGEPLTEDITFELKKGWNIIGWPYLYNQPITEALAGLEPKIDYSCITRFNSRTKEFEYFSNNPRTDSFDSFQPCRGYYIYMLKDKTVTVKNCPPSPGQVSFTINDTAIYTDSVLVNLTFSIPGNLVRFYPGYSEKGIKTVCLSNDKKSWSEPKPFYYNHSFDHISWELSWGEGQKTVYARFFDSRGIVVAQASDSITLKAAETSGPFDINSYSNAIIESSPIVADLDNNGSIEVIFGSRDGKLYCVSEKSQLLWKYSLPHPGGFVSSPAAADLDDDGDLEVLVGSDGLWDIGFYCIDKDGRLVWEYETGNYAGFSSSAAVGDLDGDGETEILAGSDNNNLYCIDSSGKLLWKYKFDWSIHFSSPAIADIDGDGRAEVFIGSDYGYFYCIDSSGKLVWEYKTEGHIRSSPSVADLDNDGNLEIIVGAGHQVHCIDKTGRLLWTYSGTKGSLTTDFAVADLDGDGACEVLTGSTDKNLHCITKDGKPRWKYKTDGRICYSSPVIADLDGNGSPEILIGSEDKNLYCIDKAGRLIWKREGISVTSSFAIADLDGDGNLELLFGTDNGRLYYLDKDGNDFVPAQSQGERAPIPWPMLQHDSRHSGLYDRPQPGTPVVSDEGESIKNTGQLYASWTSENEEADICKYEYKITEGSKEGALIRDWTSTGKLNYVTAGLSLVNDKTYFFGVKAKNNSGVWSEVGYSDGITVVSATEVVVDVTAPNICITSPDNNIIVDSSAITVSGTVDDATAQVTVNGQPASVSGTGFVASDISLVEGENTVVAVATDHAGNKGFAFVTVTLQTPCSAPTINPVKSPTNIVRQTISGRKSVDATQIIVTSPTATAGKVSFPTSLTWSCELTNLSEGENIIDVVASNISGNTSEAASTSIFVDTIGPRLNPVAQVIDEKNIELTYNEEVIGALRDANYSISPSLGTISAWPRDDNVYCLTTSAKSIAGINYTVTVENVTDLLGNPIDLNSNTATFVGTALGLPTLLVTMVGKEYKEDKFGSSVASAGDVNGDGFADVLVGAPGFHYQGKAYLYFGGPSMDEIADVAFTRKSRDDFGYSVASCGDINGDGYADVVIGAPGAKNENLDFPHDNSGKAYIYFGGPAMDDIADMILVGEQYAERFGYSVAPVGDINGDGYDDLAVGAPFWHYMKIGKVYIYYGGPSMDNLADVVLEGEKGGDRFGRSVSCAGDVNDDGFPDVIVGAPAGSGKAYIYFGGPAMDNEADFTIEEEDSDRDFGCSVASCGDVNNDGFSDFVIGRPNSNGKAYIYFGGPLMDTVADVIMDDEKNMYDEFGYSVASAGDVNNDGFSDIIVGAPEYHSEPDVFSPKPGKAYIYFGGTSMDNSADATIVKEVVENVLGAYLGCSVATAGDINGDGFDEFIIGASEVGSGEAYIYTLAPIPPGLFPLARVIDAKNVEVSYNEEVIGADAGNNYCIAPDLGVITVLDKGDNTYLLTTELTQESGESYAINVTGVTDVDGIPLDPNYSQATFIGYDSSSVPCVDSFQVFDRDTKDAGYTDSSIIGVSITESDPDGRIAAWLINEESKKPPAADFVLTNKPVTYSIAGGEGSRALYAWVMDADGNISELSANSQAVIVLDTTAPKVKIISPANDSLLSTSGITVSGSISDVTATSVTVNNVEATVENGQFIVNGLVLQQGANIIAAAAEDLVGHTASDNITVILDTTPPSPPAVIDDGDFTMFLSGLHASWSSSDLESGIKEYRYAIGTRPGGMDVIDWTSAGTDTKVTRSDLVLKHGRTYYWTVVAINEVGLESEPGISDGIEPSLAMARTWITEPAYGQTIYGDVMVKVNAVANLGVMRVEFYLDEELQYTDTSFPYEWDWFIVKTPPGVHTLKVLACDIMGNIAVDQIMVIVAEADTLPPQLLSPARLIDEHTIELTYSEEVIGALNPANYSITPDLLLIDILDEGNNTYHLLTDKQIPLTTYTIIANNVTDLSGNLIHPEYKFATFISKIIGSLNLTVSLQGEEGGDYFGHSVASAGDVNADGYSDVIVGTESNKAYIYFGGSSMDDLPDVTMAEGEEASDYFGHSVASAGDVNADGYSDVIVGTESNKAYIYFGGPSMDNLPDVTMIGRDGDWDTFGCSVASAGDVNGDGYDDVIVGAKKSSYKNYYSTYSMGIGKAYLYFGGPSMDNLPDVTMAGEGKYDYFGQSVASAGDVNADGYSDVIVGADSAGSDGKAYIYFGGPSMDNLPDVTMIGRDGDRDTFGCSVASAGDINADGYSDVIVGAQRAENAEGNNVGKAYIYFGGPSIDNLPDVTMAGEYLWDYFGCSVSCAGDVNGDGYSDVIVGADNTDDNRAGSKAYIYFGGPSIDNLPDVTMADEDKYDHFGRFVASAGDVNGNGASEVIIGAHGADEKDGEKNINIGKAYVYSFRFPPPKLNPEVCVLDAHDVEISYTQRVLGALKSENYEISPNLGEVIITEQGNNTYRLTTSLAQMPEEFYIIKVNGISDTAGVSLAQGYNQASFYGYNDGVDNTPPSAPIVTDDGRRTSSRTTLYARWSSQDAESGIIEYEYGIGSTFDGAELIRDVLDWTSAGMETEIMCADLDLSYNTTYYFVVRAKNGVGLWSKPGMSDGITVDKAFAQISNIVFPKDNISRAKEPVSISVEAAEPGEELLEYQFLIDGAPKRSWGSSPNFVWTPGLGEVGLHTVQIQVRNSDGQISTVEKEIYIFRKAIQPPTP